MSHARNYCFLHYGMGICPCLIYFLHLLFLFLFVCIWQVYIFPSPYLPPVSFEMFFFFFINIAFCFLYIGQSVLISLTSILVYLFVSLFFSSPYLPQAKASVFLCYKNYTFYFVSILLCLSYTNAQFPQQYLKADQYLCP